MWECAFLFSLTIVPRQREKLSEGWSLFKKSLQDFVGRRAVLTHTEWDVGKNPVLCWQSQHAVFAFSLCSYASLDTSILTEIRAPIDHSACCNCTFLTSFRLTLLGKPLSMRQNEKQAFFPLKMKPDAK